MASDSTYGSKPVYYGGAKSSPVYYGSSAPAYGATGATGAYGAYGQRGYYYGSSYGEQSPTGADESVIGTITVGRILRVISQRWISVLVFLFIGIVVAFAFYRISPTIYEAKSLFTMDTRRQQANNGSAMGTDMEMYGSNYEEIFNTRLSDWRSSKIITKIIQQYRANYPASQVTDKELIETLYETEIELIRRSRLITIAVRSTSATLAAALANSYAETIEVFTEDENKARCDKAVRQIHDQVEQRRRTDEKMAADLLEFRTKHEVDNLTSRREILQQSLQRTTVELLDLESKVTAAAEWEKVLESAQKTPENFGALPSDAPRSQEIAECYNRRQKTEVELRSLKQLFTEKHPSVQAKEKEAESAREEFVSAVSRALATAHGNLVSLQNQLAVLKAKVDRFKTQLATNGQQLVAAEAGLKQLEEQKEVSNKILTDLIQKENDARIQAEQLNEIVTVGPPATVPEKPVLPNGLVVFSAGAAISFALGLLFVLVLDHLEDTVVSLKDIEGRLALKVLVVLPHVRRKMREQVAKFVNENKYSHFAEAVAGLRNMLDSPRYKPLSQVTLQISTQPGEGKTITSCSLAISYAQTGKRVLLVDFDLRRPRNATIWGVKLDEAHSFSHFMAQHENATDFSPIVSHTDVPHLDLISSLPPDRVNPSSILGSQVVNEFFRWARANYDHVIVDSPPYGIVGDVMTLSTLVDSVMILCCPDRTHFRPIQHAYRMLRESGANVIGIIVNDVDMGSSGSAFSQSGGSGYGYGYGYSRYGGYRAYGDPRPYGPIETAEKKENPPQDKAPSPASKTEAPPTVARETSQDLSDVADEE